MRERERERGGRVGLWGLVVCYNFYASCEVSRGHDKLTGIASSHRQAINDDITNVERPCHLEVLRYMYIFLLNKSSVSSRSFYLLPAVEMLLPICLVAPAEVSEASV